MITGIPKAIKVDENRVACTLGAYARTSAQALANATIYYPENSRVVDSRGYESYP